MRSIIRLFKGAGILNLLGMTVAFASNIHYNGPGELRLELQQQNQRPEPDIHHGI